MLLFMDGMSHYDSAGIPLKYSNVYYGDSNDTAWTIAAEGRYGNCLKRTAAAGSAFTDGYLDIAPLVTRLGPRTPTNGGVFGFAIKVNDLDQLDDNVFLNNNVIVGMEGDTLHWRVHLNRNGTFTLIRAQPDITSAPVPLAQSAEGLQDNSWAYIEFKWVIHATAGVFQIRANHVLIMDYHGPLIQTDIVHLNLGVWNAVRILGMRQEAWGNLVIRMCDLYLGDLTAVDGDDVDDFLGDGVIQTIMPNGVGDATTWEAVGAAANWDTTNDRPAHDGDGTYVRTATPGAQDLYQFENIPVGATVLGVHYNLLARKEEEGSVVLAPVVRQGATDYVGPEQGVSSLAYDRYLTQPYDTNPATLAPWTDAEVNAGQWGVKKVL